MTAPAGVLDRAWDLAPQVSVRPEAFGALLYHFGTRRLSFLKDRRLLAVVEALGSAPSARAACTDAGVEPSALPAFEAALARLAGTDMLRERQVTDVSTHEVRANHVNGRSRPEGPIAHWCPPGCELSDPCDDSMVHQ